MKTLILILIIASLLQATFLPINLTLIVLICRSFIKTEKSNLILAFGFGLLASHLNLSKLGIESILYIVIIQLTQLISKTRLTSNFLFIVPITFVFLSLERVALSLTGNESVILFPTVLIESLISLPVFFLVRVWEERFIVKRDIKLRM